MDVKNLDKYQDLAMRTRPIKRDLELQKLEACMGLSAEYSELGQEIKFKNCANSQELIQELGDTLWYAIYFCSCYDIKPSDILSKEVMLKENSISSIPILEYYINLGIVIGDLNNLQKKIYFHNHKTELKDIHLTTACILYLISILTDRLGYTLKTVCDENILKLRKRYPSGFNYADSINRKE